MKKEAIKKQAERALLLLKVMTLRKEKHLNDNIGETIEIKLFKPINKKKEIIGVLKQFDENTIVVLTNDEQIEISRRDISQIKKVYEW